MPKLVITHDVADVDTWLRASPSALTPWAAWAAGGSCRLSSCPLPRHPNTRAARHLD